MHTYDARCTIGGLHTESRIVMRRALQLPMLASRLVKRHLCPAPTHPTHFLHRMPSLTLCCAPGKLKLEPLLRDAELLASYAGPVGRDIVAAALAASSI